MHKRSIQLNLNRSAYHYEVLIGRDIFEESLKELLSNYNEKNLYIVTNDTIDGIYPNYVAQCLPAGIEGHLLILPDGEEYKTIDSIQKIYDFLAEKRANRNSWVVAFGGGVIGDMVGFAAASFMRGIGYIQVPTTLLSQVDSSIGGKTGYNHKAGKNFIGAFKQPLQTIIDVNFLETLPHRELTAGYAELIKHALIKDCYLFEILHKKTPAQIAQEPELLIQAIHRSCEVKALVVQADETEKGQRAMLNFGHTLGHYIETFTNYNTYLHGECVIAGMEFSAWYSHHKGWLPTDDYEMITNYLKMLGLKLTLADVSRETFVEIIEHDKKAHAKGIRFVALEALGKGFLQEEVTALQLWEDYKLFLAGERIIQQSLMD